VRDRLDAGAELVAHGVDGAGEIAELVVALDPVPRARVAPGGDLDGGPGDLAHRRRERRDPERRRDERADRDRDGDDRELLRQLADPQRERVRGEREADEPARRVGLVRPHGDVEHLLPERVAEAARPAGAGAARLRDLGPRPVVLHGRGVVVGVGEDAPVAGDDRDARGRVAAEPLRERVGHGPVAAPDRLGERRPRDDRVRAQPRDRLAARLAAREDRGAHGGHDRRQEREEADGQHEPPEEPRAKRAQHA
jgi:hypothetical protein